MSFASTKDLAEKNVSFDELGPGLYAYTAEGDPNTGIIVGDDGVMVIDAQATPVMAQDVIARIRDGHRQADQATWCCRTTTRCACSAPPATPRAAIIAPTRRAT